MFFVKNNDSKTLKKGRNNNIGQFSMAGIMTPPTRFVFFFIRVHKNNSKAFIYANGTTA